MIETPPMWCVNSKFLSIINVAGQLYRFNDAMYVATTRGLMVRSSNAPPIFFPQGSIREMDETIFP